MRSFVLGFILILATGSTLQATETDLDNIDAVEAMAIANQWKWSRKDVKSFVTAREVVFQFADGNVKKIALPEDKMIVAVAPYIQQTHQ